MLDKLENFNGKISTWCEWLGAAAMLLMMAVTCIDVVGAKLFTWRLLGALDVVMLSQVVAIAFSAGMVLLLGRHIEVEFFVNLLPQKFQKAISLLILFLSSALFGVIIWRLVVLGRSFQVSGEYSPTAYIPLYPFAYGIAAASVPVLLALLFTLLKSLFKRTEK